MCKFGEEGKVAFYKFEVESDRGDCFVDRYGNTFISSDVIPSPIAKIQARIEVLERKYIKGIISYLPIQELMNVLEWLETDKKSI